MSKAERLNERVSELLTAAVQRVLEAVRDTVQEYEEKSAKTQRENERLRRRVQELQDQLDRDSAGTHKVLAPRLHCVPFLREGGGGSRQNLIMEPQIIVRVLHR